MHSQISNAAPVQELALQHRVDRLGEGEPEVGVGHGAEPQSALRGKGRRPETDHLRKSGLSNFAGRSSTERKCKEASTS